METLTITRYDAFNLLTLLIRLALGASFVYAGFTKAVDLSAFAEVISDYGLVPEMLLMPAAVFLVVLEMTAGLGLMLGQTWAIHAITGLLLLFIAVLAYGLWLGLDVDCGCFASNSAEGEHHTGARSAIVRDLIMLLGVAVLYYQRFMFHKREE